MELMSLLKYYYHKSFNHLRIYVSMYLSLTFQRTSKRKNYATSRVENRYA